MTKILYANGDSFVFGMECIEERPCSEDNKMLSFTKHLADRLGATTYINNAFNGATNDYIFKNTIIDLKKLENQGHDPKDIFVVVGFTALCRTEIDGIGWTGGGQSLEKILDTMQAHNFVGYPSSYRQSGTFFVNPSFNLDFKIDGKVYSLRDDVVEFCAKYLWTDGVQLTSQESRLIALNDLLSLKGYNYIIVPTVEDFHLMTVLDVSDRHFYKSGAESFWQWAVKNFPEEHRKHNHFSPIPHAAYAELLFDYICQTIAMDSGS